MIFTLRLIAVFQNLNSKDLKKKIVIKYYSHFLNTE